MLIEFSVRNFRSIKEDQAFSLVADAGKSKSDNVFEVEVVGENTPLRLLKTAVVYGANASGKSNLIRALNTIQVMVAPNTPLPLGENIPFYQPFAFDVDLQSRPSVFKIVFLGFDKIRYFYHIEFDRTGILYEKLDYYPNGHPANLFERIGTDEDIHHVKRGKSLKGGRISTSVFKNQSYLSKFGTDIPNEQLSPIYKYFRTLIVLNFSSGNTIYGLKNLVANRISQPDGERLKRRLSKLIRIADTRIESLDVESVDIDEFALAGNRSPHTKNANAERQNKNLVAKHNLYQGDQKIGTQQLDFRQESAGTNALFAIGGMILDVLDEGHTIVVDEIDNSLHPKLCRFLVRLFHHKMSNPRNVQMIFATHEVTLLDRDIFRKDQIWFVEKDKFGGTEVFQASDVEGARDDTNFELWYRTGKFGGQPKIKEIEFILGDE